MFVLQVPHLNTITSVGRGSCIWLLSSRTFHRKEVDERPVSILSIAVDIDIMLNIHCKADDRMECIFYVVPYICHLPYLFKDRPTTNEGQDNKDIIDICLVVEGQVMNM